MCSQVQNLKAEASTLKAKAEASTLKAKAEASTLKAKAEAKATGPEAKGFKHMTRAEINIRSTSDSPTG